MCFSAQASFTASAILFGMGVYCIKKAYSANKNYLMIATIPLFFGLQQFIEGLGWLSLAAQNTRLMHMFSLYFIFFAYFLWPIWMPLAVWKVETKDQVRRKLLAVIAILGGIFAIGTYVPLLIFNDWLQISCCKHSILYDTNLLFGMRNHVYFTLAIYVLLTVAPFWISSKKILNVFGVLALISLLCASIINNYTFTSVWCFFVALLSINLIYVVKNYLI